MVPHANSTHEYIQGAWIFSGQTNTEALDVWRPGSKEPCQLHRKNGWYCHLFNGNRCSLISNYWSCLQWQTWQNVYKCLQWFYRVCCFQLNWNHRNRLQYISQINCAFVKDNFKHELIWLEEVNWSKYCKYSVSKQGVLNWVKCGMRIKVHRNQCLIQKGHADLSYSQLHVQCKEN